jgi:hypothetical protein
MPSACRESRKGCGLSKVDLLKCTGLPEFPGCLPGFCNLRIEKTDLLQCRPIRCPVCLLALRISIELCRRSIPAGLRDSGCCSLHAVVLLFTPAIFGCGPSLSLRPGRNASRPPGSRNYGPFRGRQTGRLLHLLEEKIRLYPLFSIHALKRFSSLNTQTDLLRRMLFNPSAPTVVKSSYGEAAILNGSSNQKVICKRHISQENRWHNLTQKRNNGEDASCQCRPFASSSDHVGRSGEQEHSIIAFIYAPFRIADGEAAVLTKWPRNPGRYFPA